METAWNRFTSGIAALNCLKQVAPALYGLIFVRAYHRRDICVWDLSGLFWLEGLVFGLYSISRRKFNLYCLGLINSINWPASIVWVFIAQMVEHYSATQRPCIRIPLKARKIFFRLLRNCLNCDSTAMVTYSFHLYSLGSHHLTVRYSKRLYM